jgi:DNA-binding transcriptional regulator YiaG
MNFANRLKAWRKATGLSQSQAADYLGVSARTLQEWEQERFEPIHLGPIVKLMDLSPAFQAAKAERQAKRKRSA